jgi:DNA repair photolyase
MHYVENPPNPWEKYTVDWIGEPPETKLEVFEETATRQIITHNDSPDVGFDYTVNCYRGCPHACTYCFSRPTHEYLGFSAGTDFETKIVAKVRAPELLRNELSRKSWKGEEIVFSFTSDPYVPMEAHYRLTRRCLEICREFRQPVGVITKSALVRRDIDLLQDLTRDAFCVVNLTIPFRDYETARALEPFAPSPAARFRAMKELADAGIRVNLGIAPVIPGLNDSHIPELMEKAKECGASGAFINLLRLPGNVAPYFEKRLRERLPTKADRVMNHIREERNGKLNNSEFFNRMKGTSKQWEVITQMFKVHKRRLGFDNKKYMQLEETPPATTFRRPTAQGSLFE